jgi:AhpD family alkylhydroperoxidase
MSAKDQIYPQPGPELAELRKLLAPGPLATFRAFSRSVFAEGALPTKTKQLIAVAVAHVTQCPYCIRGHTAAARQHGATAEEIMEAIWVAAEMRAGAAYAHSALALDTIENKQNIGSAGTPSEPSAAAEHGIESTGHQGCGGPSEERQ